MIIEKMVQILATSNNDSNEYIISHYCISHRTQIYYNNLKDVTFDIGVSISTMTRFCQSMGYQNYSLFKEELEREFQELPHYQNRINEISDYNVDVSNKKRIIIIGDAISIGFILSYRIVFINSKTPIEIKVIDQDIIDNLNCFNLNNNDLIIYLSIYKSNVTLLAHEFEKYNEIINYLRNRKINYLFIGKTNRNNNFNKYNIPLSGDQMKDIEIINNFFNFLYVKFKK